MGRVKKSDAPISTTRIIPAVTPEARENQLISLAVDLAERQLRDGSASAQVITHYLKLGTVNAKLEREKLERENKLLEAKAKAYETAEHIEELYANAIKSMRDYSGHGSVYDD